MIFKINPEFKALVLPLPKREREELFADIRLNGYKKPIYTWNNTLLVDYEVYDFCIENNIAFETERLIARHYEDVILWICKNQLERKMLTEEMRKYLIGKRYLIERALGAHSHARAKMLSSRAQSNVRRVISTDSKYELTATSTRERLGKEYHVSFATIRKYGILAEALDVISEECPEFTRKILWGEIRFAYDYIVNLAQLPPSELRNTANLLLEDEVLRMTYASSREAIKNTAKTTNIPINQTTIKNMPAYDPDAELSGLTYTIPSWESSITRVMTVADISKTSAIAKSRLRKELINLRATIDVMLSRIKE